MRAHRKHAAIVGACGALVLGASGFALRAPTAVSASTTVAQQPVVDPNDWEASR